MMIATRLRLGLLLFVLVPFVASADDWPQFRGPERSDVLYALGGQGDLVCLETATGKQRWRVRLAVDLRGDLPYWGYSESPLVDGPNVICTPGGSRGALAALDKKTGKVVWQSKELQD